MPLLNGSFKRDHEQLLCSLSFCHETSHVPRCGASTSLGFDRKTLWNYPVELYCDQGPMFCHCNLLRFLFQLHYNPVHPDYTVLAIEKYSPEQGKSDLRSFMNISVKQDVKAILMHKTVEYAMHSYIKGNKPCLVVMKTILICI